MRPLLAVAVAAIVTLAAACGSGSPQTVPRLIDAHAERDVGSDGAARLTSTVTVHFAVDVRPAGGNVPFASHFEFSVPNAKGGADRVLVKSATFQGQTVTLAVGAVLPAGTKLQIDNSAFVSGASGQLEVDVSSSFTPATAALATTALTFTDPSLVADPVTPPVTAADRDPAVQRQALQLMLQKDGATQSVIDAALARFDQLPASIVPSPKARAAIAGLTGTFAEPAIDSLLTNNNCTGKPAALVAFQLPPDAPDLLARTTYTPDGARVISLNPLLESDRIEHLMPLIAHESIHCDRLDGLNEEVAAVGFETYLYMQLISVDPSIVHTGTVAAREMNVDALALINSGRRYPESVGLLPSPGVTHVLPGTNAAYGSFAEFVAAAYPNIDSTPSPDEPVAIAYVANLAKLAGMQPGSPFNIRYLDELFGAAMDTRTLLAAINALSLAPAN